MTIVHCINKAFDSASNSRAKTESYLLKCIQIYFSKVQQMLTSYFHVRSASHAKSLNWFPLFQ